MCGAGGAGVVAVSSSYFLSLRDEGRTTKASTASLRPPSVVFRHLVILSPPAASRVSNRGQSAFVQYASLGNPAAPELDSAEKTRQYRTTPSHRRDSIRPGSAPRRAPRVPAACH